MTQQSSISSLISFSILNISSSSNGIHIINWFAYKKIQLLLEEKTEKLRNPKLKMIKPLDERMIIMKCSSMKLYQIWRNLIHKDKCQACDYPEIHISFEDYTCTKEENVDYKKEALLRMREELWKGIMKALWSRPRDLGTNPVCSLIVNSSLVSNNFYIIALS